MDKVNLPVFYQLGALVGRLTQGEAPKESLTGMITLVGQLRPALIALLRDYHELKYCSAAGYKLIEDMEWWTRSLAAELQGKDPIDLEKRVTSDDLVLSARAFEPLLLEELQNEAIFRVTPTVGYDTDILLTQAERNLPDSAKMKLRSEVVSEIRESGKCLAYNIPTASGFHILRGLELVMVDYYNAVIQPTPKITRTKDWGKCINSLRKVSDPALENPSDPAVAKAVALLQQIKDSDRNLIMHPEVLLSLDEAIGLFKLCESTIIAMAAKLPQDKQRYIEKLAEVGVGYREEKR